MFGDFFDYKSDKYHGEDMFGPAHITFLIIGLISIVFLSWLLRKTAHKKILVYLKVMAILMPILELVKIIWESSYYIPIHGDFQWQGLLPLYLCSMFMVALPLAAYAKGKIQRMGLSFLGTLNIIGGLSNFIVLVILDEYPFFSYATFVSATYHYLMVFTGIWLLTSGYYKAQKKDVLYTFVLVLLFSIIAIPVAYAVDFDYMLYLSANGVPLLSNLGAALGRNLRPLFTIIVMLVYLLITAAMVYSYRFFGRRRHR